MRGHAHPDPTLCGENVRVSEPGNHQTSAAVAHRLRRMSGRDPHQLADVMARHAGRS